MRKTELVDGQPQWVDQTEVEKIQYDYERRQNLKAVKQWVTDLLVNELNFIDMPYLPGRYILASNEGSIGVAIVLMWDEEGYLKVSDSSEFRLPIMNLTYLLDEISKEWDKEKSKRYSTAMKDDHIKMPNGSIYVRYRR